MAVRVLLAGIFTLLFVLPFGCVLAETLTPNAWRIWHDGARLAELLQHTLALVALTLCVAGPLGFGTAILIERTDIPGRRWWRGLLLGSLFVPLPLVVSAWQAVFGQRMQPWQQGIGWAAFIHGLTAWPWVSLFVGLRLARVEAELEEDARTAGTPWRVLWWVSIPRARDGVYCALVWVVLQTTGEIAVTDMANVRTFAEEVYTQYVSGGSDALGRAVVVSLPWTLLNVCLGAWVLRRTIVTRTRQRVTPLCFPLGRWRWPWALVVMLGVGVVFGVPLVALVQHAGGSPNTAWTVQRWHLEMGRACSLHARMISESVLWGIGAALVATGLATCACWYSQTHRAWRMGLVTLAIVLWALPGPVLGFGLKEAINRLMDIEEVILVFTDVRPLRALLYEWSTPLPVLWAHVLRFFPIAVAFVWPAMTSVPRDLCEQTRVDGGGMGSEWRYVLAPHLWRTWVFSLVSILALSLGELSTSKLVQVPGRQTFVQELFNQMHYGVTTTTAALALVQWFLVVLLGGVWLRIAVWVQSERTEIT